MAKDETKSISPRVTSDDVASLAALKAIKQYKPSDEDYTAAKLEALQTAMQEAQGTETRADAALKTARDAATAAEWEFHNAMLRAKEFVIAQFGKDSDEVQAIGLKKKSDYRPRGRNGKTEPEPAAVTA